MQEQISFFPPVKTFSSPAQLKFLKQAGQVISTLHLPLSPPLRRRCELLLEALIDQYKRRRPSLFNVGYGPGAIRPPRVELSKFMLRDAFQGVI